MRRERESLERLCEKGRERNYRRESMCVRERERERERGGVESRESLVKIAKIVRERERKKLEKGVGAF